MLLHFQPQELKTVGLSGSILIAFQWYSDSSSCWSWLIQWHFQILRIYLHNVVTCHNHSQPSVCWDGLAPRPLGCWGSGTHRYCCTGCSQGRGPWADAGMRWHTAPVSRVQKAGLGVPAPRVPHVHSIPCPLYVPTVSPGQRLPPPRDTWQPLFKLCWWRGAFFPG